MRVISPDLQDLKSVAAAVLDPAGVLLEANAGFMQLLGTSPARRIGANVSLLLVKPSFAELAAAKATEGGEIHCGAFTVIGSDGQSLDLPGRAWRSAFGICIVAEHDIEAMQLARADEKHNRAAAGEREVRYVEATLTDKVSGTGTRERFDEALAIEVSRVRRSGLPLSGLMASIEGFEGIVARQGSEVGDKVLARFGYLLRLLTRPTDVPARFDTGRFAVLLPHTNLDRASVVALRIDQALNSQKIESLEGSISADFGIAQFAQGEDAAAFVRRLQGAVAKAQQSPGDTVGSAAS